MKIGFIGLGDQGGGIASRLLAIGHDVTLWARRPESLVRFADTGAGVADTIAVLGAGCDIVGICVVDDTGMQDICRELIPSMRPGSLILIHSTISPSTCVELAENGRARGIDVVDAPVSGGGQAAAEGRLTIMAGGEPKAFAKARPILEAVGSLVLHLGGVGSGQQAKLINNVLMAANLAAADHALSAAEHLGIDRAAFVALIKASSGRSFAFEVRARMPAPTAFAHGGALLAKDSRLLGELLPGQSGSIGLRGIADPFLATVLDTA